MGETPVVIAARIAEDLAHLPTEDLALARDAGPRPTGRARQAAALQTRARPPARWLRSLAGRVAHPCLRTGSGYGIR
jgi:hypothetical protein